MIHGFARLYNNLGLASCSVRGQMTPDCRAYSVFMENTEGTWIYLIL